MKKCNKCNKEFSDGVQFCTDCGEKLNTINEASQKSKTPVWLIVGIVCAVVIVLGVVFVFIKNNTNVNNSTNDKKIADNDYIYKDYLHIYKFADGSYNSIASSGKEIIDSYSFGCNNSDCSIKDIKDKHAIVLDGDYYLLNVENKIVVYDKLSNIKYDSVISSKDNYSGYFVLTDKEGKSGIFNPETEQLTVPMEYEDFYTGPIRLNNYPGYYNVFAKDFNEKTIVLNIKNGKKVTSRGFDSINCFFSVSDKADGEDVLCTVSENAGDKSKLYSLKSDSYILDTAYDYIYDAQVYSNSMIVDLDNNIYLCDLQGNIIATLIENFDDSLYSSNASVSTDSARIVIDSKNGNISECNITYTYNYVTGLVERTSKPAGTCTYE